MNRFPNVPPAYASREDAVDQVGPDECPIVDDGSLATNRVITSDKENQPTSIIMANTLFRSRVFSESNRLRV